MAKKRYEHELHFCRAEETKHPDLSLFVEAEKWFLESTLLDKLKPFWNIVDSVLTCSCRITHLQSFCFYYPCCQFMLMKKKMLMHLYQICIDKQWWKGIQELKERDTEYLWFARSLTSGFEGVGILFISFQAAIYLPVHLSKSTLVDIVHMLLPWYHSVSVENWHECPHLLDLLWERQLHQHVLPFINLKPVRCLFLWWKLYQVLRDTNHYVYQDEDTLPYTNSYQLPKCRDILWTFTTARTLKTANLSESLLLHLFDLFSKVPWTLQEEGYIHRSEIDANAVHLQLQQYMRKRFRLLNQCINNQSNSIFPAELSAQILDFTEFHPLYSFYRSIHYT